MSKSGSGMSRRSAMVAVGAGMAVAGLGGAAAAATSAADKASLDKAVEALRAAMVAGDGKALNELLQDSLTYSHSDGRVQTKAQVLEELSGKKAFASIDLSELSSYVVENVGIARHVFDAVNNLADGKTSTAHIKVLQTWIKAGDGWKLVARGSTPLKK